MENKLTLIEFAEAYFDFLNSEVSDLNIKYTVQPFQKVLLESFDVPNKKQLHLSSRQMFISTTIAIYLSYNLIFNSEDSNLYLYYCDNIALDIQMVNTVSKIVVDMLNFLKIEKQVIKRRKELFVGDNMFSVNLQTYGNKLPKVVFVDSAGFIKKSKLKNIADNLLWGKHVKCILLSTAAKDSYFHELYSHHSDKKNTYYNVYNWHYSVNSVYNDEKITELKKLISKNSWDIEYECKFLDREEKTIDKKDNIITFRLDSNMYSELSKFLIKKDINISTYLRKLIKKDLNEN